MSAPGPGVRGAGAAPAPGVPSATATVAAGAPAAAAAAATAAAVSWPLWGSAFVMGANVTTGYTPEQWAAFQHQNWQQWAHWQEQYAHWHMQYGEKYTEMMNTTAGYQTAGQPPLPPSNPTEARPPPPPDAPPPRPPKPEEETAAALNARARAHAHAHAQAQAYGQAYYAYQAPPAKAPDYDYARAAALRHRSGSPAPSEEERQFDVQFKKWEEEFEAWKRQNANHPDRAAYREYEKKFQACRAQLAERKEQMRAKRIAAMTSRRPPPLPDGRGDAAGRLRPNRGEIPDGADGAGDRAVDGVFGKRPDADGIPGLDLVADDRPRRGVPDAIDPSGEAGDPSAPKRPDLKAISRGINSILGDRKLLDMLSTVTRGAAGAGAEDAVANLDVSVPGRVDYSAGASHYGRGDPTAQDYARAPRPAAGHIPSLLDPLPFPVPVFPNGARAPGRSEGDDYGSRSRDPADRDPAAYRDAYGYDYANSGDYYDGVASGAYDANADPGPAIGTIPAECPVFEPLAVVDYDHEPPRPHAEFFEPSRTFDYGHASGERIEAMEGVEEDPSADGEGAVGNGPSDFENGGSGADDGGDDREPRFPDDGSREVDRPRRFERNRARNRDREKREERSRNRFEERNRYREKREKRERRSDSREETPKRTVDPEARGPADEPPAGSNEESNPAPTDAQTVMMIDDLLEPPGREIRPEKLAIILRGLPGSGKSYLAKLIKDREVENGGSAPRILSMDDYFMSETEVSTEDPDTGRKITKREMKYEYDESMENAYISSLVKAFKRTVGDGFFPFVIVDSVNDQISHYADMETAAKQFGFKVYVCEMDVDVQTCHKRNIHDRKLEDVQKLADNWNPTPPRFSTLDATTLLQAAAIDHVQMEDVSEGEMEDAAPEINQNEEEEMSQVLAPFTSKWDNMDDTDKLARLDGTSKPLRHTAGTMEDFLQLDEWDLGKNSQPGKKTVRWADIEERRKQEKMRAIGFVVGQTDWQRMTDPTQGSSALTQTKYIERLPKYGCN